MMEELEKNLLQGTYERAEELCKSVDDSHLRDLFMEMAYNTESIAVYSFVRYMSSKTGEAKWMGIALELMLFPFCYIEGAYPVALFHLRELLRIERSVKNLETIIFFYDVPDGTVEKEEALSVAREILEIEPDNKVALRLLQ